MKWVVALLCRTSSMTGRIVPKIPSAASILGTWAEQYHYRNDKLALFWKELRRIVKKFTCLSKNWLVHCGKCMREARLLMKAWCSHFLLGAMTSITECEGRSD